VTNEWEKEGKRKVNKTRTKIGLQGKKKRKERWGNKDNP